MQFKETGGAANRDRSNQRTRSRRFCGKGNFRFGAAHDSANPDGVRAVAIGDQAHVRIKRSLDTIERSSFFLRAWRGAQQFCDPNVVVIEGVQRMAEFEHHVIRNIDDVADAGDAEASSGLSAILGKAGFSRCE